MQGNHDSEFHPNLDIEVFKNNRVSDHIYTLILSIVRSNGIADHQPASTESLVKPNVRHRNVLLSSIKPEVDCNNSSPIHLAPNGNLFGAKAIGNV